MQEEDIDEMTFNDEQSDDEPEIYQPKSTPNDSNVGGGRIGTWGTGFQGGMKLCHDPAVHHGGNYPLFSTKSRAG